MQRRFIGTGLLTATLLLSACQTADGPNKQTAGTLLRAATGGLLGSQIGSGKGKLVATGFGVLFGAWLGSEIGKSLDEADKKAIAATYANALENNQAGEVSEWKNPDKGVVVRVTPKAIEERTTTGIVIRRSNVSPIGKFDVIGQNYIAKKTSNVRSAPNTASAVVDRLSVGEKFIAAGAPSGKPWIIVEQNGQIIGYVFRDLVGPDAQPNPSFAGRDDILGPPPSIKSAEQKVASLENSENLLIEETQMTTKCRDAGMELEHKNESSSSTEQSSYCKGPDGSWDIF